MQIRTEPEPSSTAESAPAGVTAAPWGWARLPAGTAARIYLVMLATLAAVASLPILLGRHATVVQTGSMEPHIAPGDVVVLSALPEVQPVRVGGVVQSTSPSGARSGGVDRLILHRIVGDNDDGTYTTAGDAHADVHSAPPVREQITGQARLLVPGIGLPSLWLVTGRSGPLAVWAAGTVGALSTALAVFLPRQRRAGRPDGPDVVRTTQGTPDLARPGALAVVGTGVLAGPVSPPAAPSTAAFTSRTSTRASWTVAAAPPALTPGRAALRPAGLGRHRQPHPRRAPDHRGRQRGNPPRNERRGAAEQRRAPQRDRRRRSRHPGCSLGDG